VVGGSNGAISGSLSGGAVARKSRVTLASAGLSCLLFLGIDNS